MRVLHGLADGNEKLQPLSDREAFLVAVFRDGRAFHEFHHEEGSACRRGTGVKHARDVGVIHQGQCLPLGIEAGDDLLAVHAGLDDLQGHLAADRFVLLRQPHHAEAALT